VSLVLLLLVVVMWMAGQPAVLGAAAAPGMTGPPPNHLWTAVCSFLLFYVLLVLVMGLWSRWLARRVRADELYPSIQRFHRMMFFARAMVPVVFGAGVFWLGWSWVVNEALRPLIPATLPVRLPGVLIGIAPAVMAWMGLWWSQYPADRALREQGMLTQLEHDLPVVSPPPLPKYFVTHFRLQVLFALVPVLMVVLARDVAVIAIRLLWPNVQIGEAIETGTSLVAVGLVYLLAPEILRRVLHTQPLPDGPLRRRLRALCDRTGMRVRDILLWHTGHYMGNAAVMGVVPQVRYILMTDLLVETMTDEQIEAVFAHEIGHVRHRHMIWYLVLVLAFMFVLAGPGAVVEAAARRWVTDDERIITLASTLAAAGGLWAVFGVLSRRFERQADAFAARTVRATDPPEPATEMALTEALASMPRAVSVPPLLRPDVAANEARAAAIASRRRTPLASYVSPYGAQVFASALQRVANVNNIPINRPEWLHGSIAGRMRAVKALALDPSRTRAFDRYMTKVYGLLLFSLAAGIAFWAVVQQLDD